MASTIPIYQRLHSLVSWLSGFAVQKFLMTFFLDYHNETNDLNPFQWNVNHGTKASAKYYSTLIPGRHQPFDVACERPSKAPLSIKMLAHGNAFIFGCLTVLSMLLPRLILEQKAVGQFKRIVSHVFQMIFWAI